jgi:hypothetical protein
MEEMLARSERATRAAITRLPDGSGHAEDWLDDDGVGGSPVRFVCKATKRGCAKAGPPASPPPNTSFMRSWADTSVSALLEPGRIGR